MSAIRPGLSGFRPGLSGHVRVCPVFCPTLQVADDWNLWRMLLPLSGLGVELFRRGWTEVDRGDAMEMAKVRIEAWLHLLVPGGGNDH